MILFPIIGAITLIAGAVLLVSGIRRHKAQHPRHIAILIGGMMMTAFGLLIAGFAIGYQNAAPLDLNAGTAG